MTPTPINNKSLPKTEQLALKHENLMQGQLLVVQPVSTNGITALALAHGSDMINFFSTQFDSYQTTKSHLSIHIIFDYYLPYTLIKRHSQNTALLFLQKSQRLNYYLIEMTLEKLISGGNLFLCGANDAGIKSWKKRLSNYGEVSKIDSAKHCALFKLSISKAATSFSPSKWHKDYSITTRSGHPLTIRTLPGVFSETHLDVGSNLLIHALPPIDKGSVLDFGCGAGVLGSALKRDHPDIQVDFCDIDAMAMAACKETLKLNNLEGTCIIADGIDGIDKTYDLIISNPPFHKGITTCYQTTENFLRKSYQKLKINGKIYIVCNQFLNYFQIMQTFFDNCRKVVQKQGFSVYSAHKKK